MGAHPVSLAFYNKLAMKVHVLLAYILPNSSFPRRENTHRESLPYKVRSLFK